MRLEYRDNIQKVLLLLEAIANKMELIQNQMLTNRENEYREAILQVVAVLNETKKSFQSKRLKELREYQDSVSLYIPCHAKAKVTSKKV